MKSIILYCITVCSVFFISCSTSPKRNSQIETAEMDSVNIASNKFQINTLLDSFNIAAANAEYNTYFNYFTDDAVFIGTDATENWDKKSFMIWAKPYFDKRRTWNFKSMERHIYFDKTGELAWFDELLNTQMKICRGSGVVVKKENQWKVQQYVLSMTIPNALSDSVISIKTAIEDSIIKTTVKN